MSNLGQLFDKEGEGWATAENLQKIKNGELTVEEAKKEFEQIQAENNDNADKTNFFGADQTREGYKNQKWDFWDWVPDDWFNSKDEELIQQEIIAKEKADEARKSSIENQRKKRQKNMVKKYKVVY